MSTLAPRVVVVSRRSELDELLARHGTQAAAGYFLRQRGRDLAEVTKRHAALQAALTEVGAAVPADWRRGHVDRVDLPRFLFAPEDIVVAVGPDGLVANVAKYLDGQPVIGVNPEPDRNPGVLVRHAPGAVRGLLRGRLLRGGLDVAERSMVAARLDDGQELVGLNEVYLGHATHQSSRYTLSTVDGRRERQSSSGVVVGTGTGATGWLASLAGGRRDCPTPPSPGERSLLWFVREAWPSPATGVSLTVGRLAEAEPLTLSCESERLVVFADGVEQDHLEVGWGQQVTIALAERRLHLVS
jgi:NAD kinase